MDKRHKCGCPGTREASKTRPARECCQRVVHRHVITWRRCQRWGADRKATFLGEQLNIIYFSYSRGWRQRFKQRRGIKRKRYEGEADSVYMVAVTTGRSERQQVLAANDPEDVFNIDETGLFYRIGSYAILATSSVKDRITVALTAKSTGSVKIKPFVIARVARPRCVGKTYNPDKYLRYRSNKKPGWHLSYSNTGWRTSSARWRGPTGKSSRSTTWKSWSGSSSAAQWTTRHRPSPCERLYTWWRPHGVATPTQPSPTTNMQYTSQNKLSFYVALNTNNK